MKKDILKDKLYRSFFGAIVFTLALAAYDSLPLYNALLYFIILLGLFIGWSLVKEEKYLLEWELADSTFTFHYQVNLLSKKKKTTFSKDKVESVSFSSRDNYMSPFHQITIMYLSDEKLYAILKIKVKSDMDWLKIIEEAKRLSVD